MTISIDLLKKIKEIRLYVIDTLINKQMKNIVLIISLFAASVSYAQFSTSYERVQVILKNGDTLEGYANVFNQKLTFKDLNKKNKKKYYYSEIESSKFTIYGGKKKSVKKEFTLVPIALSEDQQKSGKRELVELIYNRDKLKIYGVYHVGGGIGMGPGLGGQISTTNMRMSFNGNTYSDYYCYFQGDKYPRVIYQYTNFLKTFRIMAAECFKDCEVLSTKINNKEFTKDDIIAIGDFYNDKCN